MSQRFIKGLTNNHLNFVMVDGTDFATPESALSAAIKIKIYGQLRSATGTNFVSSGTGSLTNDITHVGASVTGQYQIALAKADLSDASAAWYDQYVITLSATGAAYQTLIVDGGIIESYLSAALSDALSGVVGLSDFQSKMSDIVSDILSTLGSQFAVVSNYLSDASSIRSNIYSMLVAQSDAISNIDSAINSQYSDLLSTLGSQFVNQSNQFSYLSNTVSGLGAGQSASAIADKVWSDFGSKTGATPSQLYSVVLIGTSAASNAASGVTVLLSRIAEAVATASDVASKVWAEKYTAASNVKASTFGSALRLNMSRISDIDSALSSQFVVESNYLSYLSTTISSLGAPPTASKIS